MSRRQLTPIQSLSWALDPARWGAESGAAAGLVIQDWQRDVVLSTAPQLMLLCSRQAGKSTIVSLLALHTAIYRSRALALILAPTENQSKELLRKCSTSIDAMHAPPRLTGNSSVTLEFANGSRIVSLPGSNPASIRGYSDPTLIIIDEAAWFADEVYAAVRPMMSQGRTRLAVLSSAGGRAGWYYNEYTTNAHEWEIHRVVCYDCAHLSIDFLNAERLKDERIFRREYLCEFAEFEDQVFRLADIEAAITSDVGILDLAVGL